MSDSPRVNEPEPSYYAVIPAKIRYHLKLATGAKLLFGEITALTKKEGYCWASNKYFANLYQVTDRTIRNWLADLTAIGAITAEISKDEGNVRRIWLGKKISVATEKNDTTPTEKNFHQNSTRFNRNNDKTPKPPRGASGDNGSRLRKEEAADRIAQIFNRRRTTPWSDKEVKAFNKLVPFEETELAMVERYYKGMQGKDNNFCRRDIQTFLNNYRGEVDRAYAYCQRHPIKSKTVRYTQPEPEDKRTPEEIQKSKDFIHGEVEKLRQKMRMPEAKQ